MSPRRIKLPHLEVVVALDTNALYTGSASYFLRREVADLIEQTSNLPELTLRWIVPEIVRHERQFQMLQEAFQMLPTIEKLERLLGHNLNITSDILEARVREAVDRQVQQYGLVVKPLDSTVVDWPRLILDAAYRKPPFQPGEKEKGFRDALILETFLQIVASSATSRSVVRLALVSNDQLLRDAAQVRVGSSTNVHLLESIDALKGLINTLGSAVDEGFISAIKERAAAVFFRARDESTLYYKASVGAALEQAVSGAALNLPPGADKYNIEKWTIGSPRFVKKQGQRIFWTTRFEARLKALKSSPTPEWPTVGPLITLSSLSEQSVLNKPILSSSVIGPVGIISSSQGYWQPSGDILWSSKPTLISVPDDQFVGFGAAHVDVTWSLAVTTSGTLTKRQLESVDFVEAIWG